MENGPCDDTDTLIVVVCCCLRHLMHGLMRLYTCLERDVETAVGEDRVGGRNSYCFSHSLSLSPAHDFRVSFSLDLSLSERAAIKCFCSRRNPILDAHLKNVG